MTGSLIWNLIKSVRVIELLLMVILILRPSVY